MAFDIYFLIRFISEMNDGSSEGKKFFVQFYSVNVKRNWVYLGEKKLRPGAKIARKRRLS